MRAALVLIVDVDDQPSLDAWLEQMRKVSCLKPRLVSRSIVITDPASVDELLQVIDT